MTHEEVRNVGATVAEIASGQMIVWRQVRARTTDPDATNGNVAKTENKENTQRIAYVWGCKTKHTRVLRSIERKKIREGKGGIKNTDKK